MNRVQWFLNKICQESSELIKDATKTAMFGLESYDPQDELKRQNLQLVVEEFFDVVAAFEQFIDEIGVREYIPLLHDLETQRQYILAKQQRNESYLQICMNIGTTFNSPKEGHVPKLKTGKTDHCCKNCRACNCNGQCGCSCDVPSVVVKAGGLKQCAGCLEYNYNDSSFCTECGSHNFLEK